jgi:hypothetical protein
MKQIGKPVEDGKPREAQYEFKKDDFRSKMKAEPTWSTELNEEGKVVFKNRRTGDESHNKPKDWDGEYIIGQERPKDNLYERTFGDFTQKFCTKFDPETEFANNHNHHSSGGDGTK